MAQVLGHDISNVPTRVDASSTAKHTGGTLWRLRWYTPAVVDLDIDVDGATNRVVNYSDALADRLPVGYSSSAEPPMVGEAAARSAVNQLLQQMPVDANSVWQITTVKSERWPVPYGSPAGTLGNPHYWVIANRYINGQQVWADIVDAVVNPFSGKLDMWSCDDGAILPESNGPIVPANTARQTAIGIYNTYMNGSLQTGDTTVPNHEIATPTWYWISDDSTLCHLTYHFDFILPRIADPNPGNTDPGVYHGRAPLGLVCEIDATTGECVGFGNTAGGMGPQPNGKRPATTPRTQLLSAIVSEKPLTPLALAIASSISPAPAKDAAVAESIKPASSAKRFLHRVGKRDVLFAFDARANCLSWQQAAKDGPGDWATVALPKKSTDALQAWLDKPASASKTTSANAEPRSTAKASEKSAPLSKVSGRQ